MPRSKNDSGLYEAKGTLHFNVKYQSADAIFNRILARDLKEFRYSDIEWVWIVEAGRRATPDEIRQLCNGKWKGKFLEDFPGPWKEVQLRFDTARKQIQDDNLDWHYVRRCGTNEVNADLEERFT